MRAAWLALVACGAPQAPAAIGSTGSSAVPREAIVEPPRATGTCEPDTEQPVAGNADRVRFEDPITHRWGFKTRAGAVAIPARFAEASEFLRGGVASVRTPDGWRFIDPSGATLGAAFIFDNGADYFQEGFARIVDPSGRVGFVSAAGKVLVAPRYDFAYPFCHGTAKTAEGGKAAYIDTTGKPAKGPAEDDRPLIPPRSED